MKNYEKKNIRREEAEQRTLEWTKLSPREKLDSLIKRGHGSCKQAEKLREILEEEE